MGARPPQDTANDQLVRAFRGHTSAEIARVGARPPQDTGVDPEVCAVRRHTSGKIDAVPNSPTGAEPENAVTMPIETVQPAQKPAATPRPPKSLSRRIARRILGPTLMLRKD
ncbi:hypothetical protein Lesp02_04660 [Lentzea sp. NBRC 105346]|nr:hypothetical protein Lesp02_04660 [Lentzea sp. NBRC 105346]